MNDEQIGKRPTLCTVRIFSSPHEWQATID